MRGMNQRFVSLRKMVDHAEKLDESGFYRQGMPIEEIECEIAKLLSTPAPSVSAAQRTVVDRVCDALIELAFSSERTSFRKMWIAPRREFLELRSYGLTRLVH